MINEIVGEKRQVWNGTATKTRGGLRKKDLMKTKDGRIVSIAKHKAGKNAFKKMNSTTKALWRAHTKRSS